MPKPETFVGIIDSILEKPLREDLKNFFQSAMPENDEITVILARKGYALFSAFCKAYPTELGGYRKVENVQDGRFGYVIHDHLLHEVLSLNSGKMPSKIKVVDDSLLHGTSLRKCFKSLRKHGYNGIVEAYVFAVNEQLADDVIVADINGNSECKRPLYFLEQSGSNNGLFTGTLIDNYMFRETTNDDNQGVGCDYKISYSKISPRRYLRKLASKYIETIHSCSVGYVVNYPVFNLKFDDASRFFEDNKFPDKDDFSCAKFKQEISSFIKVVHDATFTDEVTSDVCSISAILKDKMDYEQTAMIRMHANYNLREILIIPYMFHHQLMCDIEKLYESALLPQKISDSMRDGFPKDNNRTMVHAIRYNRSIEIAEKVFGNEIDKFLVPDLINSIFGGVWPELKPLLNNKSWFAWVSDTNNEQIKRIEAKRETDSLWQYSIPPFFPQDGEHMDSKSFDFLFDMLSNIYRRSDGVDIISFVYKIMQLNNDEDLAYTFIIIGQDRGVAIPFTYVVYCPYVKSYAAVMRERDGEMSNMAYAGVKELAALPWLVYAIKVISPQESWSSIKRGLRDIVYDRFSNDKNNKYLPMIKHFFNNISDYEIGDYVIHDTGYYVFDEKVNPEQRVFHEIFEDYSNQVRNFNLKDKQALPV